MKLTNTTSQIKQLDTYTKRGSELLQAVAVSRANFEALPAYDRFTVRDHLLAHLNRLEGQIKTKYLQRYP